jgi:uncharacterized protein YaeQ
VLSVSGAATIYTFDIELADSDRGVYETLALRIARHPSETEDYLLTRTLAYCLEHCAGIEFSKGGLSEPGEPAVLVRDLTGTLQAWIEIGTPDAARLHRASKAVPRVAVYCHKDPKQLRRQLAGQRIHRAEALGLFSVDREFLRHWVERLERRMAFSLAVSGGEIYLTLGDETLTGRVTPIDRPE